MKLCKDCKYSSRNDEYAKCNLSIKPERSIVSGDIFIHNFLWCEESRSASLVKVFLFKYCGKQAKYWEAK